MKKIKHNPLKIFIPVVATVSVGGLLGGIFSSNHILNKIKQNQSSMIDAGWDTNFEIPIYKNSYNDYHPKIDNLFIISAPNTKQQQSFTIESSITNDNQVQVNNYKTQLNHVGDHFVLDTAPVKKNVFHMEFSKQQFINNFRTKYKPDIGFLFNISFTAFSEIQNKEVTISYEKRLTGFSLDDLSNIKTNTYDVFSYDINSDFANLLGGIKAQLVMSIDRKGTFSIDFNIENSQITAVNPILAKAHPRFNYQFDFGSANPVKPIIFWNTNQINNLDSWFWPIPKGPSQNSNVQIPLTNLASINADQYNLMLASKPAGKSRFEAPFKKVSQFSTDSKETSQNLMRIVFPGDRWQQQLYNRFEKIPNNPGLQIKFNLYYSVDNVQYNNNDIYNVPLYGYFSMKDLTDHKKVSQTITNYDISEGRENNIGNFSIQLTAEVVLNGDLIINVSATNKNLEYLFDPSSTINSVQSQYQINDLELMSVPLYQGPNIDKDQIQPQKNFVFNYTSANNYVFQQNIKATDKNINGKQSMGNAWAQNWFHNSPYLANYNTIYGSQKSVNIASYVENNQQYAKNSSLKFNFMPIPQNNNQMEIYTTNRSSSIQLLKIWAPDNGDGWTSRVQKELVYINNLVNNNQNSYTLKIGRIPTTPTLYNWQIIYSYWSSPSQPYPNPIANQSGWDSTILTSVNSLSHYGIYAGPFGHNDDSRKLSALMRVKYYLEVSRTSDYNSINYRLAMQASSWQWFSDRNFEAAQGKAGYGLRSIELQIDTKAS